MARPTEAMAAEYAKRPGTSGIRGQLYETKLLSLIYFRAIHDDNIEEFHLATNVDNIGSFDDICFRVKWKQLDKPVVVFMQVKHKEYNQHLLPPNKTELLKYFKSYLEIKRKFHPNNKDVLFKGKFSDTECLFVIYTTAKLNNEQQQYSTYNYPEYGSQKWLSSLIGTSIESANRRGPPSLRNVDLSKPVLEEQITALAQQLAKCILGEINDIQMLMQNEYVIRYHVILAQKVFDVSEGQTEGHRVARFRDDFFNISEEFLQLFKDELCTEILKRRKCVNRKDIVFSSLRDITDVKKLYEEVQDFITYRNGKFEWLDMTIQDSAGVLNKINESHETIRKTLELAVKKCLPSLEFKVPASFGNKDLMIRGDERKVESRLNYLASQMVTLMKQSKYKNIYSNDCIIFIDKTLGEGFLQHNGGIASAIGNLLILNQLNQLKFTQRYGSLGPLAKRLFEKIHWESEVRFIYGYVFKVTVEIFPKLSFELVDENPKTLHKTTQTDLEREYIDKLLFYTSQYTEQKVEETLIDEINKRQSDDVKINSDVIFLQYHDAVQKWWMMSGVAPYLTKEGNLYQLAVKHTSSQLLTSIINMTYHNKNKNYTLSEDVTNSINFDHLPSQTIIVTDNSALTVAKFTNNLNKDCIVLDLESILNLPAKDNETLRSELTNIDEKKTIIVIFDKSLICTSHKEKIENIAKSIYDKKLMIIAYQNSLEIARRYFSEINNVVKDERCKLRDMSKESQKRFLENAEVIFQRNKVYLAQVLDDESATYVEGDVLYKLMYNTNNVIGKSVINSGDISKLYIQRTIIKVTEVTRKHPANERVEEIGKKISTLLDIEDIPNDKVVVIVGDPGMGKSTLLTLLSLQTKELDPTVLILRINLLENSKQFCEWKEDKTDIDCLESLKFLCRVALSEEHSNQGDVQITLEECNGTVQLKNCTGDEWTAFELKLFLHYFNTKNIIILFDGFDEICPTYANEAFTLIKAVETFPQKHKILITSRAYDKIITILELQFRTFYKIKPLEQQEQRDYLETFWEKLEIVNYIGRWAQMSLNPGDPRPHSHEMMNLYDFSMFLLNNDDLKYLKEKHLAVESKTRKSEMPYLEIYLSFAQYLARFGSWRARESARKRKRDHDARRKKYRKTTKELPSTSDRALPSKSRSSSSLDDSSLSSDDDDDDDGDKLLRNTLDVLDKVSNKYPEPYFSKFVATPLHLNMIADYLCNQITKKRNSYKWDTNIFDIYETFMETKLKSIRFQEKNKNDMSKPDNISHYKKVFVETMDNHKKLAAYAIYDRCLFDDDELKQCEEMINELKNGEEKTGIISNVVNDIPIFVHSTFAEYFAVEHICDLLKSKRNPKSIWDFILNVMFFMNINAQVLLNAKVKIDKELTALVRQNKQIIFELLLEQGKNTKNKFGDIKSSLCEAVRHDLRHLGSLLLSTIEFNLKEEKLMDFIKIVKETNMLIVAIKMEFEDVVVTIVDSLRTIDESKLSALFENIESLEFKQDLKVVNTDQIVQMLHTHVWKLKGGVPEWQNVAKLADQINFIKL